MTGDEKDDLGGEIVKIGGFAARLETRCDGHLEDQRSKRKAMLGVDFARSERTSSVSEVDVRTDITHECWRSCLTCKHEPKERRIDDGPFDGEFAFRIGGPRRSPYFVKKRGTMAPGRDPSIDSMESSGR